MSTRALVGLGLLVAACVALYIAYGGRTANRARGERGDGEGAATDDMPVAEEPTQRASGGDGGLVLDRKRADEMREKIRALLAEAGPAWGSSDPGATPASTGYREMPGAPGSVNNASADQGKYIQSVMHSQFFPMALQCYGEAEARHPGLAGRVLLDFRIVGDKRVGGVVDTATLGDAGPDDIRDLAFTKCMTESMMSVSFDAPPRGGEVTVKYPIEFSPD